MTTDALAAWLELHCRTLPGVRSAAITAASDHHQAAVIARWPDASQPLDSRLTEAGQRCRSQGRSLIQLQGSHRDQPDCAVIATPLDMAGLPQHTVLLDCEINSEEQCRALLQQFRDSQLGLRPPASPAPDGEMLLLWLATMLVEAAPARAATALCDDLAAHFRCDAVFIATHQNHRHQLLARSADNHQRTAGDYLSEILQLMDESADFQQTTAAPAIQPGINALHAQYARNHGCSVLTLPLVFQGEHCGSLQLQRRRTAWQPQEVSLLELLAAQLAPLLQLQQRAALTAPQRFWQDTLTTAARRATLRHVLIALGLLATTALSMLPVRQTLPAAATLEASVQRVISAPAQGYIGAVHVRPGDHVSEGQLLLQFEDRELKLEQSQLDSQLAQQQTDYSSALAQHKRTEMLSAQAEIREIQARLALINTRLTRTQIRAPFDGYVMAGDLTQQLGAAIAQGDALLTLAPDTDYRLRLEVAESDMTLLQDGAGGELQLTARPEQQFAFRLTRLTPLAEVSDSGNVFIAEAALQQPVEGLRPGMTGLAKIDAGDSRWLLRQSRTLRQWLRRQSWKWLP